MLRSDDQRQRLAGAHLSAAGAHEQAATIHDMVAEFMDRQRRRRSAQRHRRIAAEQRRAAARELRFADVYLSEEAEPKTVPIRRSPSRASLRDLLHVKALGDRSNAC